MLLEAEALDFGEVRCDLGEEKEAKVERSAVSSEARKEEGGREDDE